MNSGSVRAYEIAGDHVLAKLFEEELTLVNLDTGEYFAAGGIAVDLWDALSTPMTAEDLVTLIAGRYDASAQVVEREIDKLLAALLSRGLLKETSPAPGYRIPPPPAARKPWPDSWLEVYGDLKELLLLDPVHEVNEGAWPPPPKDPMT
jgi:hypothetical protein